MNRNPSRSLARSLFAAVALSSLLAGSPAHAAKPTTAECLAASENAIRLGKKHSLRDQRAQLLLCSAASCPGDIRRECTRRVEEVSSSIPTITFEVKDDQGQDLSSVELSMDGELLAERLDGTALSIDPGEHTFSFQIPGRPPLEKRFVIREGQKDRRESIVFSSPKPTVSPPPPAHVPPLKAANEPSTASAVRVARRGGVVAAAVVRPVDVPILIAEQGIATQSRCAQQGDGERTIAETTHHVVRICSVPSPRPTRTLLVSAGLAVNHNTAPPTSPAAPTMNATVDTLPAFTASALA